MPVFCLHIKHKVFCLHSMFKVFCLRNMFKVFSLHIKHKVFCLHNMFQVFCLRNMFNPMRCLLNITDRPHSARVQDRDRDLLCLNLPKRCLICRT